MLTAKQLKDVYIAQAEQLKLLADEFQQIASDTKKTGDAHAFITALSIYKEKRSLLIAEAQEPSDLGEV